MLDDFHDAASHADYRRYFSHFAQEAVFIGTDATERWTVQEFRVYAKRRFDAGDGWTYVPRVRHVYMSPSGNTAWFDEILDNEHYGETRSTGVLIREDGAWKIAQYHLTIPIPNDLADRVVAMIREDAKRERRRVGDAEAGSGRESRREAGGARIPWSAWCATRASSCWTAAWPPRWRRGASTWTILCGPPGSCWRPRRRFGRRTWTFWRRGRTAS